MPVSVRQSDSELVRQHAQEKYISIARRRGQSMVVINVGDVHKALKLRNRVPLVCAALSSQKFLRANNLRLAARTGPQSGQSTTVNFTFELMDGGQTDHEAVDPWETLRGIGKEVFASLGGGEAFLRRERAEFDEAMESRERQSRS